MLTLLAIPLVIIAMQTTTSRGSVLAQLERPATFASAHVGPGPVSKTIASGNYSLHLALGPNRAAARNTVTLALSSHGVPVHGARLTVTYGMPAMAMNNALRSSIPERAPGSYSLREPVLGMPGSWAMHISVVPPRGRPFSVTVDDALR